jgi:serine/threonine protein kinase
MYERSQLEKIFAVLGVPNGNQKPENRKPDGDAKGDDASWPDAACHPFWPRAVEDGLSRVARVGFPRRLAEDPNHASLLNLVRALCRYDPRRRPSAADALTHPYFAETPEPSRNALDPGAEKPETYPRRKIKSAEDGAPREAGEATRGPAPRGAAGAAALNAVRSYGDLMR